MGLSSFAAERLGAIAGVSFGIQVVGFVFAFALKTEKFYDLTGAITSLVLLAQSNEFNMPRTEDEQSLIATSFSAAWAVRLGLFLFVRVIKDRGDSRFDKIKTDPVKYFFTWFLQGLWVFLTQLPVLVLNLETRDGNVESLGDTTAKVFFFAGAAAWGIGFVCETVADGQKFVFKRNPDNKGKFITTGLWKLSRHPNYFGEILLWWGMFSLCLASLGGSYAWIVVGPCFVTLLITKVSGIPLLEESADKRWGSDPDYQRYKASTNCLIPWIPRNGAANLS